MPRKSCKIESGMQLKMICVPHSKLCKFDHIYINVELFGETQKTKLMHPYFPIKSNDSFNFEKILWSPRTKKEAFKLLKESPVSIELRHLMNGSSDSVLLGYADSNAYEFLIAGGDHEKDSVCVEKQIELNQTEYHCGPSPKLQFTIRTAIKCSETPVIDELLQNYAGSCRCCQAVYNRCHSSRGGQHLVASGDMYSCNCELHKSERDETSHCKVCHEDKTLSVCENCLCKLKKKSKEYEEEILDFEETKTNVNTEKMRPPFVVRKVPRDIVARIPDAYDSPYNQIVREQTLQKSPKLKKLRRLRSCSPAKGNFENHSTKIHQSCYACLLPTEEVRINCDACNLTARGELSNRNSNNIRPEPPLLKTYREVNDQRPIYMESGKIFCQKCKNKPTKPKFCQDDPLYTSCRPLYLLDGYRNLAKYFSPSCRHG